MHFPRASGGSSPPAYRGSRKVRFAPITTGSAANLLGRLAFSAAALDAPALDEGHPGRTSARSRSGGSAHTPAVYPSKANPAGLADVNNQRVRRLKKTAL